MIEFLQALFLFPIMFLVSVFVGIGQILYLLLGNAYYFIVAGLISYFFFYKLVVKLAKASVYLSHERRGIKAKATNEEIATVIAVSAATVAAAQAIVKQAKKNGNN